ncbi:MAG: ComEC family competence protein [Bacteroidetes bacterium]|nr:ComEC family competence protein [Bacteroidota bacterium]
MWSIRPFVRILFFFVIGILLTKYITVISNIDYGWLIVLSAILLVAVVTLTLSKIPHKYNWITGLLFGVLITISGMFISTEKLNSEVITMHSTTPKTYFANIISNPIETNQAVKVVVRTKGINADTTNNLNVKKVLCYFAKDSVSMNLKYGDLVVFTSKLTIPVGPMNPGEFDYQSFLGMDGIFFTTYISSNNWKLIGYHPSNYVIAIAGNIRQKLLNTLSENGLTGDNYAVAAAVLLGYDDGMEQKLKQDYIMAGAMHILCVSGLHVGIIYLVLSFVLGFLRNTRFNNILRAIILLLLVWAYAAITGLSPSVQRASLMISAFIIGSLLNRHRDTYNTLAVSALLLLIFNPNLIFNVGFQLSYAAVLGIITFHQPIYRLLYFKNSIVDKIWSITVLSFAAQLATFPIATYYFHFFPPWFWLTNLFTFPLSFLIITSGLVFVITSWIPIISQLVGMALSGLIFMLNYIVGIVKFLPVSGIENIYTSLPMVISIYLLIIFTFLLIYKKKIHLLIPFFLSIIIITILMTYHSYNVLTQKKVVIYSINKHSVFEFIDGRDQVIISDSSLINSSNKLNYHLKNSRSDWGITNNMIQLPKLDTLLLNMISKRGDFILYDNLTILINNGTTKYYPLKDKLSVDLIVMCGKESTNIIVLSKVFISNNIIIDSSVPPWKRKLILKECNDLGISCHDVSTEGALVLNL